MKKFIFVLITLLTTINLSCVSASASGEINVALNGELLEFDVPPRIINDRTLVPMRTIFEALGATVYWDDNAQKITAKDQNTMVVMQINSNILLVNGNAITLDVPPQLVDERTLVPIRAVAESFNCNVLWDDDFNGVVISDILHFNTSDDAHNYLTNWLLHNGTTFAEYIYVGCKINENENIEIQYYPEGDTISFAYTTFDFENQDVTLTRITLEKTNTIYPNPTIYTSGSTQTFIQGAINREMHNNNYPLSYETSREVKTGEFGDTYNLLEYTRNRINFALEKAETTLALYNTGVTLNSLGFEKY